MLCSFHRRDDLVPLNWFSMTADKYGEAKFGTLRFGSNAISRMDSGRRVLTASRSPAVVVSDCANVTIRFDPPLHLDMMNG